MTCRLTVGSVVSTMLRSESMICLTTYGCIRLPPLSAADRAVTSCNEETLKV